tara:strand:- start:52 stop:993 length:942 start_codon:yes stop_codon:yes gene_type:complete
MANKYGVLDLGSNTFHLKIVKFNREKIVDHFKHKEFIQFGLATKSSGKVKSKYRKKSIEALSRISEIIKKDPPSYLKVIATNSLRNINDNDFLKDMEKALGSSIKVISPEQEGKLIYDGVVKTTDIPSKDYYIIDIGGSSTEIIFVKNNSINKVHSFNIGSLTLNEKFFLTEEPVKNWHESIIYLSDFFSELHELRMGNKDSKTSENSFAFGTSGTIKSVIRSIDFLRHESKQKYFLNDFDYISHVLMNYNNFYNEEKKSLKKFIDKNRLDIMLSGLSILYTIMIILNINSMVKANGALREGVLYKLFQNQNK